MKETITRIYEWLELSGAVFGDRTKIPLSLDLVKEEYEEFLKGNFDNDYKQIVDGLVDVVWTMCNNTYFRGILPLDVIEMFEKVADSNYSKFCKTEEEAQNTVIAYGNGAHWDKKDIIIMCYYTKVNDYYIVKRNDNDKIMKSINYIKV